jgi:CheY-specific phosphatase CheX
METTALAEKLQQATTRTFELLAFLCAAEPDATPPDAEVAAASIGFSGPQAGYLRLRVPQRMVATIAANMLGLDEAETTADQQRDALGETLNVICGNLLPALEGPQAVFRVLAPEVPAGPLATDMPPTATTRVAFDEGWAEVALHLAAQEAA